MQTNQFAGAISSIPEIVQRYMDQRMNEAIKVAVQILSDRLCDEAQKENIKFLKTIDENMQKIIKEQVKEQVKVQVSKILPKIEQTVNEKLEAEVLTRNLYKALVEAYESDKIILDTYGKTVTLKRRRDDDADKDKERSAGSDRGSKRRREGKEPESASAPKEKATRNFFNFLMNRLKVDTLTPELLAGLTYELMKGSCKSLMELEFFLEEVYKATTDQLDWVNPEGTLSRKYTTSVTKTKAADYGHIKWIKDLVPRTMWIQELVGYEKHALWGISHWGRKRQQSYGFAVNQESARDVYSKQDLQLSVESYQKKLNLTRPDTYGTDLKRKEAYNAYSNPRGFLYQNKDKHNRLMQIDELHKFSDGTLTDVRTALDDRLKWIRMNYLPQSIWRKSDKDRAAAMIQAIDKRLKTRRIMRSLERFIGERLYEGDFRMLQKTI
nr:hypothetical protein [Tanacetum cinerariifolium]